MGIGLCLDEGKGELTDFTHEYSFPPHQSKQRFDLLGENDLDLDLTALYYWKTKQATAACCTSLFISTFTTPCAGEWL